MYALTLGLGGPGPPGPPWIRYCSQGTFPNYVFFISNILTEITYFDSKGFPGAIIYILIYGNMCKHRLMELS